MLAIKKRVESGDPVTSIDLATGVATFRSGHQALLPRNLWGPSSSEYNRKALARLLLRSGWLDSDINTAAALLKSVPDEEVGDLRDLIRLSRRDADPRFASIEDT